MLTEAVLMACLSYTFVTLCHAWCNTLTDVPGRLLRCFWEHRFFLLSLLPAFWGYATRILCYCVYNSAPSGIFNWILYVEMNIIQLVILELLCWMKQIYRGLDWLAWGLGPQKYSYIWLIVIMLEVSGHIVFKTNLTWDWTIKNKS